MTDPNSLDPGTLTTINIVVLAAFQLWSRLLGNAKTEQKAKEVMDSTPTPKQVSAIELKVDELRKQVAMLEMKAEEIQAKNSTMVGKVLEREDAQDLKLGILKRNNERLLTRAGIAWEEEVTTLPADKPKEK